MSNVSLNVLPWNCSSTTRNTTGIVLNGRTNSPSGLETQRGLQISTQIKAWTFCRTVLCRNSAQLARRIKLGKLLSPNTIFHRLTMRKPTLDAIKARFPEDHHKVRRVQYTLHSLHLEKTESLLLPVLLEGAKEKLDWRCKGFALVFSHEKTVGESHTCIEDILRIVQRILVTTLTHIAQYLSFKTSVSGHNKGGLNGYNTNVEIMKDALNFLKVGQMIAIKSTTEVIIKINALNVARNFIPRLVNGFDSNVVFHMAQESMNSTMPILEETVAQDKANAWDVQWADPDHPTWGGFAIAEHTTDKHRETSRKNPSTYDSMKIDHHIFFRRFRKVDQDSEPSGPSENETGTEPESSQNEMSTRVLKLFGIRKFRSQSEDPDSSYLLQDNLYGNVVLHLVDENESPMGLDSALCFFIRNSHQINERVQQLQSEKAKLPPEYMQPLVPRSNFPTPEITIIPSDMYISWAEAFAGRVYEGFSRDTNKEGSLKWNGFPGGDEKTDSDVAMYHQILHEVNGDIDTLDALGIPLPPEREVKQHPGDDGNYIFSVSIPERLFKDEIDYPEDHDMCGTGFYTGVHKFKSSCHKFINSTTNTVTRRISTRHIAAEEDLSSMVVHLKKRFPTYRAYVNVKQLDNRSFQAITPMTRSLENVHKTLIAHNKDIELEAFKTLQNGLVSKAYADSSCLVSCFPIDKTPSYRPTGPTECMNGTCCRIGCYDPVKANMEALRGFKDDGGAWNRGRLDHEIDYYCGGHVSDDEIPCSKGDRRDNRCCRKSRGRPNVSGGLAAHPTVDSRRDLWFQDFDPYYQNFTYENMQPGTPKNPFYENQQVFGWNRCDPVRSCAMSRGDG